MNILGDVLQEQAIRSYRAKLSAASGLDYNDPDTVPPLMCIRRLDPDFSPDTDREPRQWSRERGTYCRQGKVVWCWTKEKDANGRFWSFRVSCGMFPRFSDFTEHKQRQQAKAWARAEAKVDRVKIEQAAADAVMGRKPTN